MRFSQTNSSFSDFSQRLILISLTLSIASASMLRLEPAMAGDGRTNGAGTTSGIVQTAVQQPTVDSKAQSTTIAPANWTFLILWTATKPSPFEGSENKYNLVYDVVLTNFNSQPGTLKQMDISDPLTGKVLQSLSGKALEAVITKLNEKGLHFAPTECAIAWINLSFDNKFDVPPRLSHRLVYETVDQDGKPKVIESHAEVLVDEQEPVVISPPLKGDRWIALGGYNGTLGHRRALLPFNNHLYAAQTYAIDWMKLDKDNHLIVGDKTNPANNVSYGQPVLAVVDATVAAVNDRFDDQVPDKPSGPERLSFPTGNTIVLDLSHGYYATYAHLKRGSISVKPGDHVNKGQVIAQVGNSGNTSAPHLHFHVTKGVGPLEAQGIPYVIDSFEITDEVKDIEKFMQTDELGKSAELKPSPFKGKHVLQLPGESSVVKFAE